MGMADDNARLNRGNAAALEGPLRMSKAQPLEYNVCSFAGQLAAKVCARVKALYMEGLPLPLGYVVKTTQINSGKEFGTFLMKATQSGEVPVNEKDPIVELCLIFYRDVKDGLGPKIEKLYQERQAEFQSAETLLTTILQSGTPTTYAVETNIDSSQPGRSLDRRSILGEEK